MQTLLKSSHQNLVSPFFGLVKFLVSISVFTREGNSNPLQCSCLENPRDGGAWWAAVYGVTQSRTRLKQLSSSSSSVFTWYKIIASISQPTFFHIYCIQITTTLLGITGSTYISKREPLAIQRQHNQICALLTPVFWPREFHGLYSTWGHRVGHTEQLSLSLSIILSLD